MEVFQFNSNTNTWLLGFSDKRDQIVAEIPYNYSDFFSVGFCINVSALIRQGEIGPITNYKFHSNGSIECPASQIKQSGWDGKTFRGIDNY